MFLVLARTCSSLYEKMSVMRCVRSDVLVVVTLTVFLQLASPANNKYDNGRHVKTPINIREQDHIERSHAGPEEYVTRHAIIMFSKQNNLSHLSLS